jgi:hypothetical protein
VAALARQLGSKQVRSWYPPDRPDCIKKIGLHRAYEDFDGYDANADDAEEPASWSDLALQVMHEAFCTAMRTAHPGLRDERRPSPQGA